MGQNKNESGVGKSYSEICEKNLSEDWFGQVMRGWSFANITTHGDRSYPVIGLTNEDGKIS